MRRAPGAAAAVAALVLVGCTDDEPATDGATSPAPTGAAQTASPEGEGQTATAAPTGEDGTSSTAGPGGVEGGEDGQAAADVAAAFLVAMVNAEPEACDHLLSFTDLERPMTDVEADYEMCTELLPEVLRAETEAQGLDDDEQVAAELEGLVIRGADVDGDTAVVDADNYPPDLATSMGDAAMTLKRIDDRWYVDLDNSFTTPTAP